MSVSVVRDVLNGGGWDSEFQWVRYVVCVRWGSDEGVWDGGGVRQGSSAGVV